MQDLFGGGVRLQYQVPGTIHPLGVRSYRESRAVL